jgi:hypothetical protein
MNMRVLLGAGLGLFTWAALAQDPMWYARRASLRETFGAAFASFDVASVSNETAGVTYGPWYVLGPFDNAEGRGFDTPHPPEKSVDLAADAEGAGGRKIRWRRMDAFKDGQPNSLMLFDKNESVCAYVTRAIDAPCAMRLSSEFGSDDALTVWLNGERLLSKKVDRPCKLGDDCVALPLKPGRNVLLLKVCQNGGGWSFAFAPGTNALRLPMLKDLLDRDFPDGGMERLRLDDLAAQYDRLEVLRSGKLPCSRFAKPEFVLRREALLRPDDRDPADIVLRQTEALLAGVRALKGARDLSPEAAALDALRSENGRALATDTAARRTLYLRVCEVRRRIAFANPLLDFDKILFITHKKNGCGELAGDHMAGQYYGIHATKGEGLFVLENAFGVRPAAHNLLADSVCSNGRFAGMRLSDGAYLSPDLSFDGKRVLFAYTEAAGYQPDRRAPEDADGFYSYSGLKCTFTEQNGWHLFCVNADGTDLRNVTDGRWNDFDPCWMPNGKIAFISDRRGGFGRCHMTANGGAPWFTYTLHAVDADGGHMVRLSHHETCEWQPSIANDGMIVYTRWDYVDRGFFQAHHPWTTTPDGRNAMAIHGNYPRDFHDRPCMEMNIRAIPDSRRMVAVAAAHHGQTYGSLVMVDPGVEDDDAMAPVKVITPDERFPESEYGYFCREASYATPWPLSEDYYLCVFGYPSESAHDSVENYGIYLLDAFGNRELLFKNPMIACLSPIPLKARPMPPVIPETVEPCPVDPKQPRLNLDRPGLLASCAATGDTVALTQFAVVSIQNVYESRLAWPEGTTIKALRVVQVLPKSTPGRNNPAIGYGTEKNARAVLGTVPVESDGSVLFYLKPYVPVYFQMLDERGMAVQSMRSDVYVSPRENLSCVGCHERRKSAPPSSGQKKVPLAMRRAPSVLAPEPDGTNPFSFVRLVQPVLDKNCAACHARHPKEAPTLSGVKDDHPWLPSYRTLKPFAFFYDGGGAFTESKTFPGKFGARASKLYALLSKGHHDVKLSPDDLRRITLWLDCNSDFYGTYENIQAQACGEIVRPILE